MSKQIKIGKEKSINEFQKVGYYTIQNIGLSLAILQPYSKHNK